MDPIAPKDSPYMFSFRTKKRDYFFAVSSKEERDNWLKYFDMLLELRERLNSNQPLVKKND